MGYETYHKILDEAVQELKETEFKDLFMKEMTASTTDLRLPDCQIETDLQIIIPENYVSNISERLSLYNQLDNIDKEEELSAFQTSLIDRFGPMPPEVQNLVKMARIRWKAEQLGFEKLTLKSNILKCYFVSSEKTEFFQADKFGRILDYIKNNPKKCSLKELKSKLLLTVENLQSIDDLDKLLSKFVGKD